MTRATSRRRLTIITSLEIKIVVCAHLNQIEVNRPLQNNCHCKTKVADVYNAALAVALFLQSERQLKEARQELTLLVSNIIRIANAVAKHLLFWGSVIFKLRVSNCKSLPFFYFLTFEKADCSIFALLVGWLVGRSVGWSVDVTINSFNIYRHKSPLLTQCHSIPISTKLYWPSITKLQPVSPHTDPVTSITNQYAL